MCVVQFMNRRLLACLFVFLEKKRQRPNIKTPFNQMVLKAVANPIGLLKGGLNY